MFLVKLHRILDKWIIHILSTNSFCNNHMESRHNMYSITIDLLPEFLENGTFHNK